MVSLNVLKDGVFKDVKKASKVELGDKDLLTRNLDLINRYYECCLYFPQLFTSLFFFPIFEFPNLGK